MSLMRSNYIFTICWTMIFIVFFAYYFVTASIVAFEDGSVAANAADSFDGDFEGDIADSLADIDE